MRHFPRFFSQAIFALLLLLTFTSCRSPTIALGDSSVTRDGIGRQQRLSFDTKRTVHLGYRYLLFLPEKYAADPKKKWPLLIFLHGSGERGTKLEDVARNGPPKIVAQNPDFPFVLVSPQCAPGQSWDPDTIVALMDEIMRTQRIDRQQVYLTGMSMGGYGTWNTALKYPGRFAAIAPVCGGGDIIAPILAEGDELTPYRTLPVWIFHGEKDDQVPIAEAERMIGMLKLIGAVEVKFTRYPDAGHDAWTETYANPDLYTWLLSHRRKDLAP